MLFYQARCQERVKYLIASRRAPGTRIACTQRIDGAMLMIFLQPDRDDMQLQWRTLMVLGLLLVVAGELALCCITMGPVAAAGGPLGLVLVGAGALHLYAPVRHAAWAGRRLQRLSAVVCLTAGAWLIFGPSTRAAAVIPLLGAGFIFGGAFPIHAALTQQRLQWVWAVLSGGITAIVGGLMVLAWPEAGIKALGGCAALELFVGGITPEMRSMSRSTSEGALRNLLRRRQEPVHQGRKSALRKIIVI